LKKIGENANVGASFTRKIICRKFVAIQRKICVKFAQVNEFFLHLGAHKDSPSGEKSSLMHRLWCRVAEGGENGREVGKRIG